MMGTKQKLKTGYEVDYIFAKNLYCYLINNIKLKKFIKKQLSKRRRMENKKMIIEEFKEWKE